MTREDLTLGPAAGHPIHAVFLEPEGEPRAVLQITHGMAEYIGRYADFAAYLTERGFAVAGHDHPGHGESVKTHDDLGIFGPGDNADALILDMKAVTLEAKRRNPGLPVFLFGHSMGSVFVRRYMALYGGEIAGAVIAGTVWLSPALAKTGLNIARAVCRMKGTRSLSPLLDSITLGNNAKAFPGEGALAWLTSDPAVVAAYEADPLCGFPFTAGAYRDFFSIMLSVAKEEGFDNIRRSLPLLLISGEVDPVGGKRAVEKLAARYRELDFADVTEKIFPGDRHEILNEVNRADVYAYIAGWMEKRIRK